jgi:excisionase family DNA binding protein
MSPAALLDSREFVATSGPSCSELGLLGGTVPDEERMTLSIEEAAVRLGISRALAYELVRRGELPRLRLGRRIVIPLKALEEFVESATVARP